MCKGDMSFPHRNSLFHPAVVTKILFFLLILMHVAHADFQVVTSFSRGAQHDNRLSVVDTDRDSLYEIIFKSRISFYNEAIWFYEQTPGDPFQFQLVDSIVITNDTLYFMPWAIEDADVDGFYDMIGDCGCVVGGPPIYGMMVYESADSFSFPKNEVWRDTVQYGTAFPMSAFDIDQDGFTEFINNHAGPPNSVRIYEAIGDNQYDTVFTCTPDTIGFDSPKSTYAFGDFDMDGNIEFAVGGMSAGYLGATFWVYESPGDNQYEQVCQSYLLTKNIFDCFSIQDADGDGKMEFVIKGYVWATRFDVFIFEATGNNTYEVIATFELPPSGPDMCYSDAGDVDGDGTPEMIIAAGNTAYIIKAAENDSFYIFDTIFGGANIRVVDLDRDGDCEIIASGLDHTEIYEYVPLGILEDVGRNVSESMLRAFPNPCSGVLNIVPRIVEGNARIRMFDIAGAEIVTQNLHKDYESVTLDIQDFVPGVYFVQLESAKHRETKKIVVLR